MTTQQIVISLVVAAGVVAVVVWLVSRAVNSGKKVQMPTTTQYDTQDAPPPDSDSSAG